jgi:hypothetical protein
MLYPAELRGHMRKYSPPVELSQLKRFSKAGYIHIDQTNLRPDGAAIRTFPGISDPDYLSPHVSAIMAQQPIASAISPALDKTAGIEKNSPAESAVVRIVRMTE